MCVCVCVCVRVFARVRVGAGSGGAVERLRGPGDAGPPRPGPAPPPVPLPPVPLSFVPTRHKRDTGLSFVPTRRTEAPVPHPPMIRLAPSLPLRPSLLPSSLSVSPSLSLLPPHLPFLPLLCCSPSLFLLPPSLSLPRSLFPFSVHPSLPLLPNARSTSGSPAPDRLDASVKSVKLVNRISETGQPNQ